MKIGLFGINVGACAGARTAARVAQAAEAAGFVLNQGPARPRRV
jgi:hypothetical protein